MSAYDDLPEAARGLMADYDELAIAEMCAKAQAELAKLKAEPVDADRPEYGAIVCERILGHGVRVVVAPQHAKMAPEMLNRGSISFTAPGQIMLADQVVYGIVGWDTGDSTLTLELVHDHRPAEAER